MSHKFKINDKQSQYIFFLLLLRLEKKSIAELKKKKSR